MSTGPVNHDPAHLDVLALHALQVLPSSEIAAADRQIAACAQCQHEMEALRPIVDSLVDVLRPSASLWDRLARRIAAHTGTPPVLAPPPQSEAKWTEVAAGISCKLLATDTENRRVSMLVRLAPGTDYPPHRHAGLEELHLLHGELRIDDRTLYPGDYNRAEPGTMDRRVWSETGCTCVLITSTQDVIL
jgi:quercetin dioxygenase-like cupin family protein